MSLSLPQKQQYSRHLLLSEIGEKGQMALANAKVLVIGAGGLGCPVLQYLAGAGVGHITIIDNDEVDVTNLQRQVLFTHADIGKPKAQIAAQRLTQLNPYIQITPIVDLLSTQNAVELFSQHDIIVDGTDNFPTRYLINDAAVLANRPVVYGSIFKFEGQVSVFNYNNGPTYRCLFPEPPAPGQVPNCSQIGVLGVLPGVVGTAQATQVINIIAGIGEPLAGKLWMYNALNMNVQTIQFAKNPNIHITHLQNEYQTLCGLPAPNEQISYQELQELDVPYTLLDVRSTQQHQQHNIGGINIPLTNLKEQATNLPTNQPIVVYCNKGITSAAAIHELKTLNPDLQLLNLTNGISSLVNA
jgi:adenylyltransferase/sulfurtransferase